MHITAAPQPFSIQPISSCALVSTLCGENTAARDNSCLSDPGFVSFGLHEQRSGRGIRLHRSGTAHGCVAKIE